MNEIAGIYRYAVDSDNAEKIYEVFRNSYLAENNGVMHPYKDCTVYVDFSYEDGILHVEEKTTAGISYMSEILYFFAEPDHISCTEEYLKEEPIRRSSQKTDDDLPF